MGGGAISKSAVATTEVHSNEPVWVLTGTYLTGREPITSAKDDVPVKQLGDGSTNEVGSSAQISALTTVKSIFFFPSENFHVQSGGGEAFRSCHR